MIEGRRVFGVGMSKTGTTTLGACLEVLGVVPHIGFEPQLKKWLEKGNTPERALKLAENYLSFEDSPWYLIYRELDRRFPGSKFVLTVRKDSLTHAKSSWSHGVRRGLRTGEPTAEYLAEKIAIYENHNNSVVEYFKDRPGDLLVMCWENGDGWEQLCPFLGIPVPQISIPHCNQGRYKPKLPLAIAESAPYNAFLRAVHKVQLNPITRKMIDLVGGGKPV